MKLTFEHAADPLERLQQAINEHVARDPDAHIRDVSSALTYMNAVFVSQYATRLPEFGTDIAAGGYHVGVSCGDGSEAFFIDAGYDQNQALKIARELCWHNADLKILAEVPPQPFIAVNPHRIGDVFEDRGNVILTIKDSQYGFSMVYGDDQRAGIDAFLLRNKLIQVRSGNQHLERPVPVASTDGKVVALPFRRRDGVMPS